MNKKTDSNLSYGACRELDIQTKHFLLEDIDDLDEFMRKQVAANPKICHLIYCPSLFKWNTNLHNPDGHRNVLVLDAEYLDNVYGDGANDVHGGIDQRERRYYQVYSDEHGKRLIEEAVKNQNVVYKLFVADSDHFTDIDTHWQYLRRSEENGFIRTLNNVELYYENLYWNIYDEDDGYELPDEWIMKLEVEWIPRPASKYDENEPEPDTRPVLKWHVDHPQIAENIISAYNGNYEWPEYDVKFIVPDGKIRDAIQEYVKKRAKDTPEKNVFDQHVSVELSEDTGMVFRDSIQKAFGF